MKNYLILAVGLICCLVIILGFGLFLIHISKFPNITLTNDIISIDGKFDGNFDVFDMQSIDTVNVYPRVGLMHGGNGMPGVYIGNFGLANEEKIAKLYIHRNNPPYIRIRMNDSRLLLINLEEPDKTVEFFNQLKTQQRKLEFNTNRESLNN